MGLLSSGNAKAIAYNYLKTKFDKRIMSQKARHSDADCVDQMLGTLAVNMAAGEIAKTLGSVMLAGIPGASSVLGKLGQAGLQYIVNALADGTDPEDIVEGLINAGFSITPAMAPGVIALIQKLAKMGVSSTMSSRLMSAKGSNKNYEVQCLIMVGAKTRSYGLGLFEDFSDFNLHFACDYKCIAKVPAKSCRSCSCFGCFRHDVEGKKKKRIYRFTNEETKLFKRGKTPVSCGAK
jgi:hypothetical protein